MRIFDPESKENIKNNRYIKYSQSVVVGGFDKYNQLIEKSNNKNNLYRVRHSSPAKILN